MSAESSIAFYGIEVPIAEREIESFETRTHEILVSARRFGLGTYWGNFGTIDDNYVVFVGKLLGVVGAENENQMQIDIESLVEVSVKVKEQLKNAGLDGLPKVHFVWQPDLD